MTYWSSFCLSRERGKRKIIQIIIFRKSATFHGFRIFYSFELQIVIEKWWFLWQITIFRKSARLNLSKDDFPLCKLLRCPRKAYDFAYEFQQRCFWARQDTSSWYPVISRECVMEFPDETNLFQKTIHGFVPWNPTKFQFNPERWRPKLSDSLTHLTQGLDSPVGESPLTKHWNLRHGFLTHDWLMVTGTWILFFSFSWACHPNWRTHILQRGFRSTTKHIYRLSIDYP